MVGVSFPLISCEDSGIFSVLGPDLYLVQILHSMVLLVPWVDSDFLLWPLGCSPSKEKIEVKKP